MKLNTGIEVNKIRVNGGLTKNLFLMQFQSDLLDTKIEISKNPDASLISSVYIVGLGVGLWNDLETIKEFREKGKIITAVMDTGTREKYYSGWKNAVDKVITR